MIDAEELKKCTGCGACYNICPKHAIVMQLDKNGFYKPIIDETSCINCNLCNNCCPVNHPQFINSPEPECFAFMAEDNVRARSSSGGAFECLADIIFEMKGCVAGVAYREDFTTEHIIIENKEELGKLRGSKYIMSDINHIYQDVREKLKEKRKVLFTGCPCQIAGLNAYLGEVMNDENLVTIDLICHGIPSVKAFRKYISDTHGDKKITHIGFKDKEYGWHASMTIDFDKSARYNEPCEVDTFFWSYLCGINKNEACGDCLFARIPRQGDITIGDFWGIGEYKQELNDKKGTSVILLNNQKGRILFEQAVGKAKLAEKVPLDVALNGNRSLSCSPHNHVSRNQFFKNLESRRFPELAKWSYGAERFDIGLVGIPIYINFGGALTYYALYNFLTDHGYSVMLISRPRSCGKPPIPLDMVYDVNPYPSNVLRLELKDKEVMRGLNDVCETFLVGSDQLFNADLYYKFGEMVTLDWVGDNHRKVAYAASFGHEVFWGREKQRATMAHYMQKFDAFSVREEDAVSLAKKTFGVNAEWVLDPVFLCDKKHYITLANQAVQKRSGSHIFAYILDPNSEKNEILQYISEEKNLSVELFGDMLFRPTEEKLKAEQEKYEYELCQAKVEERLYSLIHSDFIVSDSYHGICFAILFQIPFIAILNENRGASRFYTILSKLHLLNRLVTSVAEARKIISTDVDFTECNRILEKEKRRCSQWLLEAVNTEHYPAKPYSSVDIMNEKFDLQKKRDIYTNIKLNALINGRLFCTLSEINAYLDMLSQYQQELIILIAVRDTPGFELTEDIDQKLARLGCRHSLIDKHWQSYIFVMDGGQIISEMISKNEERVAYNGTILGKIYKVVSRSYRKGNIAAIMVDGIDYSENRRGLNIVVLDKNLNAVIDSVVFDTHAKGIPCYREGRICNTSMPEVKKEKDISSLPVSKTDNLQEERPSAKTEALEKENEIKNSNELVLHNAMVIASVGGTAFDYYMDKGIKQVAIYGTDLLVGFLWEQAYYKEIEIVALLSDRERDITVRFPRVGKIHMKRMLENEWENTDIPILLAEVVFPSDLLKIRNIGHSVERIGALLYYAHMKRFLLDPILNYKAKYPKLNLMICNMPMLSEIENKTEQEKQRIKGELSKDDWLKNIFLTNGYDQEYVKEVMQRMNVEHKPEGDFIAPVSGKYVNAIGGYRVTTDLPVNFSNTIYVFGNSLCYGIGSHDECTITSVLQREMNTYYNQSSPYAVLNCANGGGLNAFQIWKSIQYHKPQNGDIIIIIMNNFIDLFKEVYATSFLWCDGKEVLNRPHDMGEIYVDTIHVNAKGYEAVGKLIASKLIQHQLLFEKEGLQGMEENRLVYEMKSKFENSLEKDLELGESDRKELEQYIYNIKKYKRNDCKNERVGSIVMNCNPFTLGHRYLIEEALKKCDILYIFVVEENLSFFSFEDRIDLVRKGTADLNNVIVIPSGRYIISQTTFSAYFVKEEKNDVSIDPTEDVSIFGAEIAPSMGITVRFAGDEPFDKITNQYNATMKRILPQYDVEFEVIKRKEKNGEAISASRVRRLLKEKDFVKIKQIVPDTTYQFLWNRYKDSKNVLVLGGTRFMGIRLVEKMIDKHWFITIATRGIHADSFGKNVDRILLDRNKEDSVKMALSGKRFDIVFDNSAYAANPVKYILTHVKYDYYLQVSSVAAYPKHHLGLKEEELDTKSLEFRWSNQEPYGCGKRYAECALLQSVGTLTASIVRIPFVVEPENLNNKELNMRLFSLVEHITQQKPMKVANLNYHCTFVRTSEEAEFLIYLAEHRLAGIYNFSSAGSITVGELISYIEKKSGKQAIYREDGELCPFYPPYLSADGPDGFSYDLAKAKATGFSVSNLNDWIYDLLDCYILEIQKEEIWKEN